MIKRSKPHKDTKTTISHCVLRYFKWFKDFIFNFLWKFLFAHKLGSKLSETLGFCVDRTFLNNDSVSHFDCGYQFLLVFLNGETVNPMIAYDSFKYSDMMLEF